MRSTTSRHIASVALKYWTLIAFIAILVVFAFTADRFYTQANWIAVSVYASSLIAVAVGQTFVIITGGIDLSVGGIMGMTGMVGGLMMHNLQAGGMDEFTAIIIGVVAALVTGTLIGVVNGLIITRAGLAPFIVTLGMLGITTGLTKVINDGKDMYDIPRAFATWGSSLWGGWLSPLVAISLSVAIIMGIILARTRFGMRNYAIGSNPEAARKIGLNVTNQLVRTYALSGLMAGIAGILVVSRFGSALTTTGTGVELQAIAAVVIGGASLFGGSGSMLGTLTGVAIMSSLVTGLILSGVQPFWQTVITGIVIIAAVYIDKVRDRLAVLEESS